MLPSSMPLKTVAIARGRDFGGLIDTISRGTQSSESLVALPLLVRGELPRVETPARASALKHRTRAVVSRVHHLEVDGFAPP
jgi:hypothetical protein